MSNARAFLSRQLNAMSASAVQVGSGFSSSVCSMDFLYGLDFPTFGKSFRKTENTSEI